MIARFVEEYAKKLADHPEAVRVELNKQGDEVEVVLFSSQQDMGKFIGKNGRMIHSLKNVLSGCRLKNGTSYRIRVRST